MKTEIPTKEEWEANERRMFARDLARVECASLADRQAGAADWADHLTPPSLIAERVAWLFEGQYGKGAQLAALDILARPRSNRGAQLGQIIAALDCGCPAVMARRVFNELPYAMAGKVSAAINSEIQRAEQEMASR